MKNKKLIVKVTIPYIITDNPKCKFETRDGKWIQEVPVNSQIIKWMKGKHEGYFELELSPIKIVSMKPTTETKYYASPGKTDDKLPG